MKSTKLFIAFALVVLFLWTFEGTAVAQRTVNYTCGSNTSLTATYSADGDSVTISSTTQLSIAKSASGAKFSKGKATFWTKGKDAMINLPGFNGKCVEVGDGQSKPSELEGTSWRLVKFEGSDDTVLKPAKGSEFTISFATDGKVSAKIDCNRGGGTWSSSGPNRIKFGNMALTMMMCPNSGGLDRLARDWTYVTSYVLKNGHLFLSLMADGGIYEFEPMNNSASVTGTVSYRERIALPDSAVVEVKLLDVSRADAPAKVIAEQRIETRGKQVPFSFELPYDESKIDPRMRYNVRASVLVGNDLMFTTDQAYEVITYGNPKTASIIVKRVNSNKR